jgi:hypothetical protein
MNRTKLKNYAPQARRDFIQAMTDRAAYFGLTAKKIEPVVEKGDVAVIGGRSHPRAVAEKRKQLEDRIKAHGFEQTMEALAYTWFNRLVAIRFMELHGYLDHGYRVLSHPEGKPTPEILEHAEHVDLPGLKKETAIDLKLAGNKEAELYRLLLTAQCNVLNAAMPFLFEKIDDETELLLPDNLLHSDSLIRNLVGEIDEEDWQVVEIIGWLYQFYISEKKDEVIGKVVASEDIPAATQLFTPNWIVKYLVQNTLGRQWLATYPQSALRQQMQYYIEPAEQTPDVQEQLKAITPTSLNPEKLTLLDPACGSGHILVEAYDLFKAIYQERGYRAKDIPALILQKNLFGLEIDDRAAQLTAFALMMKARADDRHIFESEAKPHILAFEDSQGMNAASITHALNSPILTEEMPPSEYLYEEVEEEKAGLFSKKALAEKGHVSQGDIASLLALFENAKTFGSLIQVPPKLAAKLPAIEKRLNDVLRYGDLTHAPAHVLKPLLQQTQFLVNQYDSVVTNPPYIGGKAQARSLKEFGNQFFPNAKSDVFAMFIERAFGLAMCHGKIGYMTPFVWLFIKSYEPLREMIVKHKNISTLIHPEYNTFWESAHVTICAFVINNSFSKATGDFIDLRSFIGAEAQQPKLRAAAADSKCKWRYSVPSASFEEVPGCPIAYWISERLRRLFTKNKIKDFFEVREGLGTRDDDIFMRRFWEVSHDKLSFEGNGKKWIKVDKAGGYRKWACNGSFVLNWENDGFGVRNHRNPDGSLKSRPQNTQYFFREAVSWGKIGSGPSSFRYRDNTWGFNDAAPSVFGGDLALNEAKLPLIGGRIS